MKKMIFILLFIGSLVVVANPVQQDTLINSKKEIFKIGVSKTTIWNIEYFNKKFDNYSLFDMDNTEVEIGKISDSRINFHTLIKKNIPNGVYVMKLENKKESQIIVLNINW